MLRTLLLIENATLSQSLDSCLKTFEQQLKVVGTSREVTEGMRLYSDLMPDLVVVGEHLADGDGMQFLRMTGSEACDRVFLCHSEDAWYEALRYGAVAGKVADDNSEINCISSAIGHVMRRRSKSLNDQCSDYFGSFAVTSLEQLALPTAEGIRWLSPGQIMAVLPDGKHSQVVTSSKTQLDVQRSVRQLAKVLLPMGFGWDSQGCLRRSLGNPR